MTPDVSLSSLFDAFDTVSDLYLLAARDCMYEIFDDRALQTSPAPVCFA